MKNLKLLKMLFIVCSITVMISGCAHQGSLKVYDRETCVNLDQNGAYCEHSFINKHRSMTREQFLKESVGWFFTDSEGQADIETLVDQACIELKCTYLEHENLKAAFVKLDHKAKNAKARAQGLMTPFEEEI